MRENSYSLPTPGKTVAAPTPGEECPGKAAQHSPYGGNEPTESMGRSHVMENPHKRKLAEPPQITTAQTGAEFPLKRPNSRRRPRKRNIQELENLVEAEECKPMPLTSRKQHQTRKKARKGISFTQNYVKWTNLRKSEATIILQSVRKRLLNHAARYVEFFFFF